MAFTKSFSEVDKNDALIAGGKGASLGEMTQAGIPVPPGFVVLTDAFEQFLKETDLNQEIDSILHTVKHEEMHTVEHASETIQALIKNAKMPKDIATVVLSDFKKLDAEFVAVRSSATAEDGASAAWAGQLDSYLNTTRETLLEKVQHCWASLFTPRAIFYRFEKGLHGQSISVAVVVQKMVNSEISGIAFSVHPVTEDYNQLIIEAGFGLGEAIVSGQVTPDSYVVEKTPRNILDINVSTQTRALYRAPGGGNEWRDITEPKASAQVLSKEQVLELSEKILTIEKHYGFPCDIEWAYENGAFYIVQSRPITTLSQNQQSKSLELSNPLHVDGEDWFLTVTRNMSFWHQGLLNSGAFHDGADFGIGAPLRLMTLTVDSRKTSCFVFKKNYDLYVDAVMGAVSSDKKVEELKRIYQLHAGALIAALTDAKKHVSAETFKTFSNEYQRFCVGLNMTTTIGRIATEHLQKRLKEIGVSEEEIPDTIATTTYPEAKTPFFNSQVDLLKIGIALQEKKVPAKKKAELLSEWMTRHAYVPVNFSEEPYSLADIEAQLSEVLNYPCKQKLADLEGSHQLSIKNANERLVLIGDAEVDRLSHLLAKATTLNEYRKNIFCKVSLEYRSIFSEVARKLGSSNWDDCFYLTNDEIISVLSGETFNLSSKRAERRHVAMYMNTDGNLVMLPRDHADALSNIVYKKSEQSTRNENQTISGFSANKGKVIGIAKVILSSADFGKLLPGEVLVTTMTSVDFVPIMQRASAFVTNEGGITSHASIVARELGKPCIIGTKNATQVISDGDEVEVDADRGIVRIIAKVKELTQSKLPRWEKVLQRNFPPLAWTAGAYYEFRGVNIGPMSWKRDREMHIRYKTVQSYMIQDPSAFYISNIIEVIQNINPSFEKKVDEYNQEIYEAVRVDSGDTLDHLKRLNDLHKWTYGLMVVGFDVAIDIKNRIDEVVKNKLPGFEPYLMTPWKQTGVTREQTAMLEAKHTLASGNKSLDEISKELSLNFGYLHQDYLGTPWSFDDYRRAIEDGISLKSHMDDSYDLRNLDEYEQWLVTIFKKMIYMYEEGRNAMVRCAWAMKETVQNLGESPDTLLYMTDNEVSLFAEGKGKMIPDDLVNKRKEAFALYFEGGVYKEYSGQKEVEELIREQKVAYMWEEKIETEDVLKGSIAFKGYFKGKVRLVFTQTDANAVEEGEVIVTPMTQVEFLSGIRKCGAIVTDEGGIISHAAIVSREFGIPCILATQKATKIFKNGDYIEVDANKGTVKKTTHD